MDEKFQHINAAERYRLLTLLRKCKDIFDGMLGTWNATPVELELKYNTKPVCSRPHPVPRVKSDAPKGSQQICNLRGA